MKFLGILIVLVLAGGGFYTWDWWKTPFQLPLTYAALPASLALIAVLAYLTIKLDRAREPRLEASELQPDGSTWSMDIGVLSAITVSCQTRMKG